MRFDGFELAQKGIEQLIFPKKDDLRSIADAVVKRDKVEC
jgi:hypothetical protein